MRGKNLGEFHYYLDNTEALNLLVANGAKPEDLEFREVRLNRETLLRCKQPKAHRGNARQTFIPQARSYD
jgi:hypothetical protein